MRSTDISASSIWMLFIFISFCHLHHSLTIPDFNLINVESTQSNQDHHNHNQDYHNQDYHNQDYHNRDDHNHNRDDHNHNRDDHNHDDDSNESSIVHSGCTNCLSGSTDKKLAEQLKLDAIKTQILSKLNLPSKPNITSSIPKELIQEALRKAHLKENSNSNNKNGFSLFSKFHSSSRSKDYQSKDYQSKDYQSKDYQSKDYQSKDYQSKDYQSKDYQSDEPTDHNNYISNSQDDYYGKTSEIIAFAEPGKKMNGHTMLVFIPPHDNVHRLQVTSATLWLQIRYHHLGRNFHHLLKEHSITLYIFKVENQLMNYSNSSAIHKSELNEELILSHKIKITRQGWKHIDLKDAVQKWFTESNNRKLTLLVDCVGCDSVIDIVFFEDTKHQDVKSPEIINTEHINAEHINAENINSGRINSGHINSENINSGRINSGHINSGHINSGHINSGHINSENINSGHINSGNINTEHNQRHGMRRHKKENYRPFIVIVTKPKLVRRTRRHALTCSTKTSQCCKQSLFVSFKELGWDDWIIAPKGYYANYCVGDCSKRRTPDTYVNFHSHVIEEYRNKNPYASITPCCAPVKLSSISLIYFDPDLNIIKADLPKMVVDECGCT